jgi:hypothetical protein
MFSFRPANRTPAHLSRMLGTGFFPSLHFHHTSQWPHQEMISSALVVLLKVETSRCFYNSAKSTSFERTNQKYIAPAN